MAVIQQFRTAVRGFNRQDVQDYIEQVAAAHRQEMAELQKRLEKSEERVAAMEETAAQLDGVTARLTHTQAALEAANQSVSRLKGELSQAESRLTAAKEEEERLRSQVAALEPLAASYRDLKDRAASVELDAHQKALAAVNEAKTEAEQIRTDTRKWLSRVLEEYSQLRVGVDGVMEQLRKLDGVPEQMEKLDETTKQLREQGGLK